MHYVIFDHIFLSTSNQVDQRHVKKKPHIKTVVHTSFGEAMTFFFLFAVTDFESRLCILSKDYDRPDGCYPHETDGGYQKRCFCHSELCNSGTSHRISIIAALFASLVTLTLKMIL